MIQFWLGLKMSPLQRQIMPGAFTHSPHISSKSEYYCDSGQDNGSLEKPFFICNLHFITILHRKERNITYMCSVNPTKGIYWGPKHSAITWSEWRMAPWIPMVHTIWKDPQHCHATATEQLATQLVVLAITALWTKKRKGKEWLKFTVIRKCLIHINEAVNGTNNRHLYLFKCCYSNQILIKSCLKLVWVLWDHRNGW